MVKNIITICLLFCFSIIGFSACEKYAEDTPQAIKKLIRENKNRNGQVIEYEYNHECIYEWWRNCDDCFTNYYDKDANLLWKSGGFGGLGVGTFLEDFYENAIYKRIVWTDKKTKEYLENKNK